MAKFRCQRNNTFSKLVRSRLRLSSLFPLSPPASGISSLASILIKTATQLSIKPTREREREKLSCPRKASDFPFDSSQSITIYAFKGPPRRLNFEWRFAPLWIDNSSLMLDFFLSRLHYTKRRVNLSLPVIWGSARLLLRTSIRSNLIYFKNWWNDRVIDRFNY